MRISIASPIPDMGSMPGPSRPGWGPTGSYDFQFEVSQGQVGITVLPRVNGLRFTIKWQDGTEQAITSAQTNLQSPTTQAGIISINNEKLDTTWCDDFKIASGQSLVTKVISWGQNPWNKLQDAFKDCTNLTEISTTSLTTDTIGNLNNLFSGCTSLTDVSIKGWNLLSGCSIEGLFDACTNIEKLEATGLALKIVASSRFAFRQVGSNVANGCEFLMSGLDFSTSTSMQFGDTLERGMFREVKIKPNSNFSNWNLATSSATPVAFNYSFNLAKMLGDNSTLNISNWTFSGTTGSTLTGFFINLETSDSTNRGLNVDITNWNFGNINIVSQFFQNSDLNTVTGLNTLTASNLTNISSFFQYATFLSIPSNDNLSLSFRNAINTTSMSQFSRNLGSALANESDWGAFPNLDGVNLSNCTNFYLAFTAGRYSTGINLGNVTFPTTALSYSSLFSDTRLSAGNGIDLTTTTLKGSNFQQMFQLTWTDFVKMGSGIDWSSVTSMYGFNYLINYQRPGGAIANSIELPTGLNLSSLSDIGLWGIDANYSQCQIDNFIRSMWLYQRPPVPSTPTLNFSGGTGLTAAPMAVRSKVDDLITAGWSFNGEVSPDVTAPFAYTGSFLINTDITPTINTSGGVFSSSDVTVNEDTGTFNTSTAVNATIRYTLPNGCYNEQVLNVVPPFTPFKFRVTGPISIKAQPAVAGQSFTIDWGDGSTPISTTGGTSIASNFTTAGTYDVQINAESDATYCDEFAIVSGQTNVTQVLDWGETAWRHMGQAFSGCTSLSDISTTSFISSSLQGVGTNSMVKMFEGCTSLLEADIRNWDLTAGADWKGGSPFQGLVNLQKLDMTNMSIKLVDRGTSAFVGIGTAVTNGCEFLMSGIDWSTTTATIWQDFVANSKINPNSTFANWVFPSLQLSINRMFRGSKISGVNSTLNVSGWSTLNANFFQAFQSFDSADSPNTDQGIKINISNLNVSTSTDFVSMFEGSDVSEIIGLSTLGSCAGNANLYKFAMNASFLKLSSSDNFSNAFIASLNPSGSNIAQAFKGVGGGLSSNFGVAPNLTNIDLSNIASINSTFEFARFKDVPDLTTATFPSTAIQFGNTFKSMQTENSNTHVDFSNVSVKISYAREMFSSTKVDNVTFGNNVDFSSCTDVYRKFNNSSTKSGTINITYPTAESGLSWAALNQPLDWFRSTTGPTTGPLTTCQVDNLIRSFHNTALNSGLTVDFGLSKITESPSVVSTMIDELENTGGWNITPNTLDATIPFEYTGSLAPNTTITPTNNTGSAFTGTFTSSNSNIAVNSSTGVINSPNGGSTTIRYTLADGCYTEQAIELVSAEFSYSASAYCDNAPDPTPTVTGTSGGIFTAALKVIPFKMKISVTSGVEKTFNLGISGTGNQFQIDWGDGTVGQANVIGVSHTYNPGGNGTTSDPIITLGTTGDVSEPAAIYFRNNSSALDILEIQQWGSSTWTSIYHGFWDARNMNITATDVPKINTANWTNVFYNSSNNNSLVGTSLANWDVSSSTSMSSMFMRCTAFNADISSWDVSSVTNFGYMLFGNTSFNRNLGNWDISSLTSATAMLSGTTSLSQANYTDTLVGWANQVYANSAPYNVSFTGSGFSTKFDGTRSGGANFATAQDAYNYLVGATASWTIS